MRFLRHNKKSLNTKVFNETDFSVLNYEQLLKVNGAGGSSGGGGSSGSSSGPSGSSSSSSGPSSSSSSSASDSPSGSSSGGKGAGQSAPSSYGNDNSSAETGVYVENSNEGVANANPGDKIIRNDGTEVTLTQGDIDWAKQQISNETTPVTTHDNSASNYTNESTNTATGKIENAISAVGQKEYIKGEDGYMCDDYVKEVIEKAGYDPKDYYVDDSSGKSVNQHIDELEKSGTGNYSTDASQLNEGTYVVFMSDEQGQKDSHAAILVVESDGSAYMQDNSSHNNVIKDKDTGAYVLDANGNRTYYGGTETTYGDSASKVCSEYTGYENWYFQKLN